MKALRRLRQLAVGLLLFTMAGVAGYHFIEGWSWFDSFYMTVITFSTVGFQEVHPLTGAGRVFTVILIIVGVGLVYFAIGTLTYALLEFELGRVFGKARMEREIARLNGHFIICGAGRVGMSVARELARKPAPFVIIESDHGKIETKVEKNWLVLEGDAAKEKTLLEARIQNASGLVAATTTDAANIYIVLTARSLAPHLRIIARASEEDAEKHLKTAGANVVISPYLFAGHRIANSFLRPNVLDFLDIATSRESHEELVIEEIHVSDSSRLAGVSVGESYVHRDLGIMVLAIKRADGASTFNPTAREIIRPGDYLIVMGEAAQMPKLEAIAGAGSPS